jgi:hypothetical protein
LFVLWLLFLCWIKRDAFETSEWNLHTTMLRLLTWVYVNVPSHFFFSSNIDMVQRFNMFILSKQRMMLSWRRQQIMTLTRDFFYCTLCKLKFSEKFPIKISPGYIHWILSKLRQINITAKTVQIFTFSLWDAFWALKGFLPKIFRVLFSIKNPCR